MTKSGYNSVSALRTGNKVIYLSSYQQRKDCYFSCVTLCLGTLKPNPTANASFETRKFDLAYNSPYKSQSPSESRPVMVCSFHSATRYGVLHKASRTSRRSVRLIDSVDRNHTKIKQGIKEFMNRDTKLCITVLKPASGDVLYAKSGAHAVCSRQRGRILGPKPTTTLRSAADATTTTRVVLLQANIASKM